VNFFNIKIQLICPTETVHKAKSQPEFPRSAAS